MKKHFIKLLSAVLILSALISTVSIAQVAAASASQIQNDINKLEQESQKLEKEIKKLQGEINSQNALKNAIEKKISVVTKQINLCNAEINKINGQISANKAEIDSKNKQIENDKLSFKKRLRAIHMSNSQSNVKILLGADDFSEFLQLSQLTASVSARDKLLIEGLIEDIKILREKQEENNKLLEQQIAIKATVAEKQKELQTEENKIQSVINDINSEKKDIEADNKAIENEIKALEKELSSIASSNSGQNIIYDGGPFVWPTTITRISSYFGTRWGKNHNGLDLANGSYGAPIYAIADGIVYKQVATCTHNYRKVDSKGNVYSCGCGGGYGNYVAIDHGLKDGNRYTAYYAHMQSVTVANGARVKRGQIIGYVGCTGRSTGPHLHFGIAVNGIWKDPLSFYRKVN